MEEARQKNLEERVKKSEKGLSEIMGELYKLASQMEWLAIETKRQIAEWKEIKNSLRSGREAGVFTKENHQQYDIREVNEEIDTKEGRVAKDTLVQIPEEKEEARAAMRNVETIGAESESDMV